MASVFYEHCSTTSTSLILEEVFEETVKSGTAIQEELYNSFEMCGWTAHILLEFDNW